MEIEAIAFIKQYEPAEGYFLGFSGGKDSIVTYDLAKRAGVKFQAYYSNTLIDPPEVVKFIKQYYPDVIFLYPKINFWQIVRKHGIPGYRKRFCCHYLKEQHSEGYNVKLLGIRAEESPRRKERGRINKPTKKKTYVHPIFYWSSSDIWGYIKSHKLPYPSLYDEGFARLGCIVCTLRGRAEHQLWLQKYPKYFKYFEKVALEHWDTRDLSKQKYSKEEYINLIYKNKPAIQITAREEK